MKKRRTGRITLDQFWQSVDRLGYSMSPTNDLFQQCMRDWHCTERAVKKHFDPLVEAGTLIQAEKVVKQAIPKNWAASSGFFAVPTKLSTWKRNEG